MYFLYYLSPFYDVFYINNSPKKCYILGRLRIADRLKPLIVQLPLPNPLPIPG